MANRTLTYLKDAFRSDVDDPDIDPTDQSGLLWSDDDVLEYINRAHSEFVAKTLYRSGFLRIPVQANEELASFPDSVLETKDESGYLETAKVTVPEINIDDVITATDDYGVELQTNPYENMSPGTPRAFSFDAEERVVKFFPASAIDDTFVLPVFLEATEIESWEHRLNITNPRHVRMLLPGMKMHAYLKHDADAFNKDESDYWFGVFRDHISEVYGERERRNRRPGTIRYGGI
jgi:hypothetical protein